MIIKCIAIDDEPPALDLIQVYADQIPSLDLVETFLSAKEGSEYLKNNVIDLVFLDINMHNISGLELARSLKIKPLIVFTTAYKDFAYDGFELEAIDYLLKPIEFERFSKAVQKALNHQTVKNLTDSDQGESLFVYSEYNEIRIPIGEIEYIESMEDYIKIHLPKEKPVLTLM